MAINERLIDTKVEAAGNGGGGAEAEQGLILHLDANDVDSYDGDGAEWVDISTFEKTIPISDNADDLELHLNASDTTSYGGSGTTWTDISGNSNDGTISGASFDTDNGGYFDFDGVNDKVTTSYDIPSAGAKTIEFWFNDNGYISTNNTYPSPVGGSNATIWTGGNLTGSFSDESLGFYNADTGLHFYIRTGTNTYRDNKWHHVAITDNGSNQHAVYVDGESHSISYAAGSSSSRIYMDNVQIGKGQSTPTTGIYSYYFNGQVGQVRIYSKALSASEVGQNYRHGRDTVYTDLIPDTDLELHLDAASFPQYGEAGYSNTPSTWTDSSGNGNNGTITGATFDSELGNWLDFDGSDDKIDVGNISAFNTTNSFTLEFWENRDDINESCFVAKGTYPSNAGWFFSHNQVYGYYFFDYGTSSYIRAGSSYSAGQWRHVVLTWNASTKTPNLFVNGEDVSATVSIGTGTGTNNTVSMQIGNGSDRAGSQSPFDGKLGQVRGYSSVLSQDQIRQNYNFTKPSYPNGNDGTISGAAWNPSGYFDFERSSSNNVTISDSSSLDISGDITLSAWINEESVADYGRLFWKSGAYSLYRGTNGWNFLLGSTSLVHNSDIPSTGTWYHIAATYDGSNQKLYINGALVDTESMTGSVPTNNNALYIGGIDSARFFDGKIGAAKIYSRALTVSELLADYNATKSTYGL